MANWPAPRWTALLTARAIENQAYVVGGNRVGRDGYGHVYGRNAVALDPQGRVLFQARYQALVHTVAFDRTALEEYRQIFPAWRDADVWPLGSN